MLLGLCHTQDAQKWLALHQLLESLRTEAGRGTLPNLAIVGVEGTSVKLRISKCDVEIDPFWKGKNPVGRSREFATLPQRLGKDPCWDAVCEHETNCVGGEANDDNPGDNA